MVKASQRIRQFLCPSLAFSEIVRQAADLPCFRPQLRTAHSNSSIHVTACLRAKSEQPPSSDPGMTKPFIGLVDGILKHATSCRLVKC